MKIIFIVAIICAAVILGIAVAKKNGKGCRVCIHGEKNAKHTGLCTIFIKKSDKK